MIILTVILCVLLLPILYLALPFLATYIPLQIISFFASIIEYFKEIFREFFPKTSNDSNKVSYNSSENVSSNHQQQTFGKPEQPTFNYSAKENLCVPLSKSSEYSNVVPSTKFPMNNAHVGVNQWELDLLSSIQQAYDTIHDLKVTLGLPIIQNNFDVHLAAMLNGLSRIIMYEQLSFVALDEKHKNKIINLIDSYFLNTVDKPNNYFYFSCSEFYQNSFPIWFENKSAHSYWYDDYFNSEYQNNEDKPLKRTIYSVLASFGDIILNEHLSNDYNLLDTYFAYDVYSVKLSDEYMNIFRKNFMIPVTKIVEDYFEVCWDYMQCCYKVEEID